MQHRLFAALALAALLPAAGCGGSLPPNVPRGAALDTHRLEGGWYVHASNFPMWLDGSKTNPLFFYRVEEDGGGAVELDDTVAYTQSGRKETIRGTDAQDPANPAHFTWRGKGLLAAFASDWVIMATAPDWSWIVLYFTKTVATPEGVDVIGRLPALSPPEREAILRVLAEGPFLAERSRGLVWLKRH